MPFRAHSDASTMRLFVAEASRPITVGQLVYVDQDGRVTADHRLGSALGVVSGVTAEPEMPNPPGILPDSPAIALPAMTTVTVDLFARNDDGPLKRLSIWLEERMDTDAILFTAQAGDFRVAHQLARLDILQLEPGLLQAKLSHMRCKMYDLLRRHEPWLRCEDFDRVWGSVLGRAFAETANGPRIIQLGAGPFNESVMVPCDSQGPWPSATNSERYQVVHEISALLESWTDHRMIAAIEMGRRGMMEEDPSVLLDAIAIAAGNFRFFVQERGAPPMRDFGRLSELAVAFLDAATMGVEHHPQTPRPPMPEMPDLRIRATDIFPTVSISLDRGEMDRALERASAVINQRVSHHEQYIARQLMTPQLRGTYRSRDEDVLCSDVTPDGLRQRAGLSPEEIRTALPHTDLGAAAPHPRDQNRFDRIAEACSGAIGDEDLGEGAPDIFVRGGAFQPGAPPMPTQADLVDDYRPENDADSFHMEREDDDLPEPLAPANPRLRKYNAY